VLEVVGVQVALVELVLDKLAAATERELENLFLAVTLSQRLELKTLAAVVAVAVATTMTAQLT
jgi:hypothetical protein